MKFVMFQVMLIFTGLLAGNCNKGTVSNGPLPVMPSHPLQDPSDLDPIMNQIGNARIVLLGEASHGTAEYYDWRSEISKRLIQEKGFDMIAVEGEWADSYRVNQFIKGASADSAQAVSMLRQYNRWPTWMWGNYEVASLVTWMNRFNQSRGPAEKIGFYGLDVYCLWESMQELMPLIQNNDSLRQMAQQVQQCFQPYSADPGEYAYAVASASANCRQQTERLWNAIWNVTGRQTARDEAGFLMQQNALVALNGERYYRTSVNDYPGSWNIRDRHMTQTIIRLLEKHGPDAKIIVWEHNTHIGDARYTDMAAEGMANVGQLVREHYGQDNVYIVGTGSYKGTVIASDRWGGPVRTMEVPEAQKGSWEEILHRSGEGNRIILSSELKGQPTWMSSLGNRAIGVVYNPRQERGNYVPTVIPNRYDAFIYFDQTRALRPLGTTPVNEPPDTYPSGY
jgi:erythromycin esterase-like protein